MKDLESYLETHYDIVEYITREVDNYYEMTTKVSEVHQTQGMGGLYLLAKYWADEFTEKYKDILWGEDLEYYRENAEEDYLTTLISVLRYIGMVEREVYLWKALSFFLLFLIFVGAILMLNK